jgi:hypothetical protein
MGFFDRAKAALGLGDRGKNEGSGKGSGKRPPLKDLPPASPAGTIDDALVAREAGRNDEGRAILRAIDRGRGLRTVLRAAAALEAGDDDELSPLVAGITASEPAWRLALQIAGAMATEPSSSETRGRLILLATAHGAPAWALAWTAASGVDGADSLRGMVDLLFADAPLARTVAAREWGVPGARDDHDGLERYATFSHGRDAIRRFGAPSVARVFALAFERGGSGSVSSP